MRKPRRKKPKRKNSAPAQKPTLPPSPPTPGSVSTGSRTGRVWAVVAAIITLIGLPGSVFAVWPRMTITASGPFDDANAYSESFTATNTGFVPLWNFNVAIGFCDIKTKNDDLAFTNNCRDDQHLPRILVGDLNWNAPSLAKDEPFTITLTNEITTPTAKYRAQHPHVIAGWKTVSALQGANAVVVATFQPWFIPCWSWISEWVCVQRARFVAEEQPNGKVMWRSVPLSWTLRESQD
jgi:hypothetical protein